MDFGRGGRGGVGGRGEEPKFSFHGRMDEAVEEDEEPLHYLLQFALVLASCPGMESLF